jgi:hypothetical protein
MHNDLRHIVEATVSASHLSAEEKTKLQKELMAHMQDVEHELQLKGVKEQDIARTIAKSFGSPEEIGKQLYMVHHRFEYIPVIGPLFYYAPVRLATKLFISHWLIGIVPLSVPLWLRYYDESGYEGFIAGVYFLFILSYSIGQGIWAQHKFKRFSDAIEAMILSHLPFLLVFFLYILNRMVILNKPWPQLFLFSLMIGAHIILMLIGIAIHAVYIHVQERLKRSS